MKAPVIAKRRPIVNSGDSLERRVPPTARNSLAMNAPFKRLNRMAEPI